MATPNVNQQSQQVGAPNVNQPMAASVYYQKPTTVQPTITPGHPMKRPLTEETVPGNGISEGEEAPKRQKIEERTEDGTA